MKLRMFSTPRIWISGLTSTMISASHLCGWRAVKVIALMPPIDMPGEDEGGQLQFVGDRVEIRGLCLAASSRRRAPSRCRHGRVDRGTGRGGPLRQLGGDLVPAVRRLRDAVQDRHAAVRRPPPLDVVKAQAACSDATILGRRASILHAWRSMCREITLIRCVRNTEAGHGQGDGALCGDAVGAAACR